MKPWEDCLGRPVVRWELWSTEPEKIRNAGGKIVVDKMDVPGVGQLSLFEDPVAGVLGMWKKQ